AVFYFAAALTYFRFDAPTTAAAGRRRWHFYALTILFFLAALLSKTVTCSLPVVLLLVMWWKRGGRVDLRTVLPLLPLLVMGLAFGLTTAHLERQHVGAAGPEWNFSPTDRLLIAGRALCFYLRKLLIPTNLTFIYPRSTSDAPKWR